MPSKKELSFAELSNYFHLPINDVSKELGVCCTILKKICRQNGIARWPHRKIRSLNRTIANLEMTMKRNTSDSKKEDILQQLEKYREKKNQILNGPRTPVYRSSYAGTKKPVEMKVEKTTQVTSPTLDQLIKFPLCSQGSIQSPGSSPLRSPQIPSSPSSPETSSTINPTQDDALKEVNNAVSLETLAALLCLSQSRSSPAPTPPSSPVSASADRSFTYAPQTPLASPPSSPIPTPISSPLYLPCKSPNTQLLPSISQICGEEIRHQPVLSLPDWFNEERQRILGASTSC